MKRIAIVGVGPTGIYTFYELVKRGEPLAITLFEKEAQAGVGMPYSDDNTAAQMLANIASIEIPPIDLTYLQWLQQQSDDWLAARGLERHALHERQFLPRVILGEYYRDRFLYLVERARDVGFVISVCESCEVTDIAVQPTAVRWSPRCRGPANARSTRRSRSPRRAIASGVRRRLPTAPMPCAASGPRCAPAVKRWPR